MITIKGILSQALSECVKDGLISTNPCQYVEMPRRERYEAHFYTVLFVAKGADTVPKRRANGEGNIRKRKDGRWEGRYTVGRDPETGKAIIKNVRGKTQAGDTVKTELIYDREKVRAESCPDFSYISQKLR